MQIKQNNFIKNYLQYYIIKLAFTVLWLKHIRNNYNTKKNIY